MSDLHPLLAHRWSPSILDPEHTLDRADLETLLTAARWAPSSGNSQPWSFLVTVRGGPGHQALLGTLTRGNRAWVPQASAVLLGIAQTAPDPDNPEQWQQIGLHAEYALGLSVAQLTVQATSMGLVVHQFAGFDRAAAATEFAVPAHHRPVIGVAIGRHGPVEDADPALRQKEARPRVRKPMEEFVFSGSWGTPW
ncbi:nitroreductase family protein [Nocardioides limicola]|uniref:nitroreductase family protein n=1 Tax=Nocardioides limicola TaxID=2803368 RepID=UPI00193B4937|nr:nitroreductase family protein [Nocardioides sp. DJM-14]